MRWFLDFFSREKRPSQTLRHQARMRHRKKKPYADQFEADLTMRKLEPRRVLSVNASLASNVLDITLDADGDEVTIDVDGTDFKITDQDGTELTDAGTPFALADVNRINIFDTGTVDNQIVTLAGTVPLVGDASVSLSISQIEQVSIDGIYSLDAQLSIDGGVVTDGTTGRLTVGGLTTISNVVSVELDNDLGTDHDFATFAVSATGDVTIRDENSIDLSTIGVGGDFTVDAGGDITDAAAANINVFGNATFIADGSIELAEQNSDTLVVTRDSTFESTTDNSIDIGGTVPSGTDSGATVNLGTVNFNGGDVTLVVDGSGVVEGANTANSLILRADDVTDNPGATVQVTGIADINVTVAEIALSNFGHDFSTVSAMSIGDVQIRDQNGIELSTISVPGNLTINAGSNITDSSGANIDVAGNAAFIAGGSIVLANQNSDVLTATLNATFESSNNDIRLGVNGTVDSGAAVDLGTLSFNGRDVVIILDDAAVLVGDSQSQSLDLRANTISDNTNATVQVNDSARFSATGDITLANDASNQLSVVADAFFSGTNINLGIDETQLPLAPVASDAAVNFGSLGLKGQIARIFESSDTHLDGVDVSQLGLSALSTVSQSRVNTGAAINAVDVQNQSHFELRADVGKGKNIYLVRASSNPATGALDNGLPVDNTFGGPISVDGMNTNGGDFHLRNTVSGTSLIFVDTVNTLPTNLENLELWLTQDSIALPNQVLNIGQDLILVAGVDVSTPTAPSRIQEQPATNINAVAAATITDVDGSQVTVVGDAFFVAADEIVLSDGNNDILDVIGQAGFASISGVKVDVGVVASADLESDDSGAMVNFGSVGLRGGTVRIVEDSDMQLDGVTVDRLGLSALTTISQSGIDTIADETVGSAGAVTVTNDSFLEVRISDVNGRNVYLVRESSDPSNSAFDDGNLIDNRFGGLINVDGMATDGRDFRLRNTGTGTLDFVTPSTSFRNLELWFTQSGFDLDPQNLTISGDLILAAGVDVANPGVVNTIQDDAAVRIQVTSANLFDKTGFQATIGGNGFFIAADEIILADQASDALSIGGSATFISLAGQDIYVGVELPVPSVGIDDLARAKAGVFDDGDGNRSNDFVAANNVFLGSLRFQTVDLTNPTSRGHVTVHESNGIRLFGENIAQTVVLVSAGSITDAANTMIDLDSQSTNPNFAILRSNSDITLGDNSSDTITFGNVNLLSGLPAAGPSPPYHFLAIDAANAVLRIDSDVDLYRRDAANIPFFIDGDFVLSAPNQNVRHVGTGFDSGHETLVANGVAIEAATATLSQTQFNRFAANITGSFGDDATGGQIALENTLATKVVYENMHPIDQANIDPTKSVDEQARLELTLPDYGLVLSNVNNDLRIVTVGGVSGVDSATGHVYIETRTSGNITIDGNVNVGIGQSNLIVFTAVAADELQVNATLRSSTGSVTSVAEFFTFDDRFNAQPVQKNGPRLIITPPEGGLFFKTSKFVDPDPGEQIVELSDVGTNGESNLILFASWAEFNAKLEQQADATFIPASEVALRNLVNLQEQAVFVITDAGTFVRTYVSPVDPLANDSTVISPSTGLALSTLNLSHQFTPLFINKDPFKPDLPATFTLFNDPLINLYDSTGNLNLNQSSTHVDAIIQTGIIKVGLPLEPDDAPIFVPPQLPSLPDPFVPTQTPIIFDDVRPRVLVKLSRVRFGRVNEVNAWLDQEWPKEEPWKMNVDFIESIRRKIDANVDWPVGRYLIRIYDANGREIDQIRHIKKAKQDVDGNNKDENQEDGSPNTLPIDIKLVPRNILQPSSEIDLDPIDDVDAKDNENADVEAQKPLSPVAKAIGASTLLFAANKRKKSEISEEMEKSGDGRFSSRRRRRRRQRRRKGA